MGSQSQTYFYLLHKKISTNLSVTVNIITYRLSMLLILFTALAILPNPTLCRNIHNIYPFVYLGERFFDADKLEVTWSFDHSSLPGANSSNSVCNDYLFYYQVQKAFLVWARHININFKYIEYDPKETEIYIRFGMGK